jgi:hypothetical protein
MVWVECLAKLHTTGLSLPDTTTAVDALVVSEHASAVEEMQTSLISLQQALQETESELPSKLRGFQDTVQTIQCSLESQFNGVPCHRLNKKFTTGTIRRVETTMSLKVLRT